MYSKFIGDVFTKIDDERVRLSANFQWAMADIRGDRRLVKDTDSHLRIRWLRADLQVGITHALSHSVNTNESTSTQEVLALQ